MEATAKELFREEFQETIYPAEKLSFSVTRNREEDMAVAETGNKNKSTEDMPNEEEVLKARLNELKKENFSLQASINAWQLTLKNKLDEFKEADMKLNEIYNEIWAERESFCSKTDKFNDEYGILSEWWERQMKFVSDLENLEKERLEDQKCQQEIERLEKLVDELKREIEGGKQQVEVEVHSTQEENCFRKEEQGADVSPEGIDTQKAKFLLTDVRTETCGAETKATKNDLFSMVDLEKVRMANRIKNRRCKSHFLTRVKQLN